MIKALLISLLTATLAHAQGYDARTADYVRAWQIGAVVDSAFPTDGLVAYWSMDSVSGDMVEDTFGSNDLTKYGDPLFGLSYGKYLNGSYYDGTGDYLLRADAVVTTPPITMMGWFRRNSYEGFPHLVNISRGTGGGTSQRKFAMYFNSNNRLSAVIQDIQSVAVATASTPTLTNEWVHAACTIERVETTYTVKLYANGALVDTASGAGALPTLNRTMIAGTIRQNGDVLGLFAGSVDEVAIWNRALSSNEVSEIYNNGAGKFYTP